MQHLLHSEDGTSTATNIEHCTNITVTFNEASTGDEIEKWELCCKCTKLGN